VGEWIVTSEMAQELARLCEHNSGAASVLAETTAKSRSYRAQKIFGKTDKNRVKFQCRFAATFPFYLLAGTLARLL
jgi:hypothetical protein